MQAHKEKHLFYIVYEMGFKDKTYGFNLLIKNYLEIGSQLKEKITHLKNKINYTNN
jgi:hypothetical protein